jgi:hypothetical protein
MSNQPVDAQSTDAVVQSGETMIAEAPAVAMGSIFQAMAQSVSIQVENAVNVEQQQVSQSDMAATQGVTQIYSVDSTATAATVEELVQSGVTPDLTSLVPVLEAFAPDDDQT